MQIKKSDGSVEPFDPQKLTAALRRAGAETHVAEEITEHVMTVCKESHGSEAVKTEFIYHLAFRQLKNISRGAALKFSLKRALLELGPSGFPFEEFIAEIWRRRGYTAVTGQIVYGTCVSHEVDVIAWKPDELVMVEAKYHSDSGSRTDLKTALYVKARYDDLRQQDFTLKSFDLTTVGDKALTDMHLFEKGSQHLQTEMPQKITEGWLITNTHFSDTAITYGSCNNLKMMSFDYPEGGSLQELVIEHALYPVTCLTTLNSADKKKLIAENIILCKTLYEKSESLKELGFDKEKIFQILEEVSSLM